MGLRPLSFFILSVGGGDFGRQILTSKVGPRVERVKYLVNNGDHLSVKSSAVRSAQPWAGVRFEFLISDK